MDSKGQIAGQVFIYIMAVIVIGGIILVGYTAIKNIVSKSCDAQKISFKTDIEGLIEKYTSYGSVNKKSLKSPCDYQTVCFVDANAITDENNDQFMCDGKGIIVDSVKEHAQQNIFVISNNVISAVGYSELIRLDETHSGECLCIDERSNNFYITFSGFGSYTQISAG